MTWKLGKIDCQGENIAWEVQESRHLQGGSGSVAETNASLTKQVHSPGRSRTTGTSREVLEVRERLAPRPRIESVLLGSPGQRTPLSWKAQDSRHSQGQPGSEVEAVASPTKWAHRPGMSGTANASREVLEVWWRLSPHSKSEYVIPGSPG